MAAQHLLQKLNSLGAEFKSYHLAVVDLVQENALKGEQVILDEHDNRGAYLVHVYTLSFKYKWCHAGCPGSVSRPLMGTLSIGILLATIHVVCT